MDKNKLFESQLAEKDVETDVGTFRIRALNRQQATDVAGVPDSKGYAAVEALIMHYGLVEPPMSVADVKRWQEASPADGGPYSIVIAAITELSGMSRAGKEAAKEAYQRFPEET